MKTSQPTSVVAYFKTASQAAFFMFIACFGGAPAHAAPAEAPPAASNPPSVSAQSATSSETAASGTDSVWEQFAAARRVFQIRLCDLAIERWPRNKKFFVTHRDLQLAYIERRNLVFYHFKNNAPSRIVRDKGGEAFLNFTWTPDEDVAFMKSIKGYKDLSAEIERLKKQSERLAHSKELREQFARLEIDPAYLALMRETTRSIGEAERLLAGK